MHHMGLDTVELVMSVEEAFEIQIDDQDAEHIQTVGELHDYIVARITMARTGTCLTASTFYRIKNGLNECGVNERFGPSSKLAEIFPDTNRRDFWAKLQDSIELRFPDLVRPNWVVNLATIVTLALSIGVAYLLMGDSAPEFWFPLIGILSLFGFGLFAAKISEPMATEFDTSFASFRGLAERALALNAGKINNEYGPLGNNDVWVVLREIIVDTLGVDHDEIKRDANFVKDLGCG